jgi:hypothetical protein
MKFFGFNEEGYKQFKQAIEWGALDSEYDSQDVVDTILKEGSAQYYGNDGSMVYFDKYDLAEIYL